MKNYIKLLVCRITGTNWYRRYVSNRQFWLHMPIFICIKILLCTWVSLKETKYITHISKMTNFVGNRESQVFYQLSYYLYIRINISEAVHILTMYTHTQFKIRLYLTTIFRYRQTYHQSSFWRFIKKYLTCFCFTGTNLPSNFLKNIWNLNETLFFIKLLLWSGLLFYNSKIITKIPKFHSKCMSFKTVPMVLFIKISRLLTCRV